MLKRKEFSKIIDHLRIFNEPGLIDIVYNYYNNYLLAICTNTNVTIYETENMTVVKEIYLSSVNNIISFDKVICLQDSNGFTFFETDSWEQVDYLSLNGRFCYNSFKQNNNWLVFESYKNDQPGTTLVRYDLKTKFSDSFTFPKRVEFVIDQDGNIYAIELESNQLNIYDSQFNQTDNIVLPSGENQSIHIYNNRLFISGFEDEDNLAIIYIYQIELKRIIGQFTYNVLGSIKISSNGYIYTEDDNGGFELFNYNGQQLVSYSDSKFLQRVNFISADNILFRSGMTEVSPLKYRDYHVDIIDPKNGQTINRIEANDFVRSIFTI